MTIVILNGLLVLVILAAMIILLITVNHYLTRNFNSDEDEMIELRHHIDNQRDVISPESSFSQLVKVRQTDTKNNVKKN